MPRLFAYDVVKVQLVLKQAGGRDIITNIDCHRYRHQHQ